MNNSKFDVISENEYGRRKTIRYKQYAYEDFVENSKFSIKDTGCGPSSLATVLSSFGINIDPISIAKIMLFNECGFLSEGYYTGVNGVSMIYCLDKLIEEKGLPIKYKIIKINYDKPELMKENVLEMISSGYMAIVNVGPKKNTFCSEGHYITITSINNNTKEFYIANSNVVGDEQIDMTFSYELITRELYKDNFDFLMIKVD